MTTTFSRVALVLVLLSLVEQFARADAPASQSAHYPQSPMSMPQSAALLPPASIASPVGELPSVVRRVKLALVRCRLPHSSFNGVLVGDRRTVLATEVFLYNGRRMVVSPGRYPAMSRTRPPRVTSERVEHLGDIDSRAYLVHLGAEVQGEPLRVSSTVPTLGARVFAVRSSGQPRHPSVAITTVAAISDDRIDLPIPSREIFMVLDSAGDLLAVRVGNRLAPAGALLASPSPPPHPPVMPILGLRFVTGDDDELGRNLGFDIEVGFSLWDRLSLVFRGGAAFSDRRLMRLTADGLGPGLVTAAPTRGHVAAEARYRLLFADGVYAYLDLVAGVEGAFIRYHGDDTALFSDTAGCDPLVSGCALRVQPSQPYLSKYEHNGVGAIFGADLRLGILVVGYRFLPEALANKLSTRHLLSVGLNVF